MGYASSQLTAPTRRQIIQCYKCCSKLTLVLGANAATWKVTRWFKTASDINSNSYSSRQSESNDQLRWQLVQIQIQHVQLLAYSVQEYTNNCGQLFCSKCNQQCTYSSIRRQLGDMDSNRWSGRTLTNTQKVVTVTM
jgi:hypothetical protein